MLKLITTSSLPESSAALANRVDELRLLGVSISQARDDSKTSVELWENGRLVCVGMVNILRELNRRFGCEKPKPREMVFASMN